MKSRRGKPGVMHSKPTDEDILIANRLRAWMRWGMAEYGITQTELARRCRMDDGNVSKYMTGAKEIRSPAQILRLCRVLRHNPAVVLCENPPAKFFEGDEIPPPF